nr:LysE family transporter [Natronobiforma cellulositropha]
MSWLSTFAVGVLFGLALAAPPGPMNAIIAEESVVRGFRSGVRAGGGAMAADVVFFVLTVVGVATVVTAFATLESLLFVLGGLLMVWFAADAARAAYAVGSYTDTGTEESTAGFRKTFVLSLTNPYQLTFWLTAGVGLVTPGHVDLTRHVPALERVAGAAVVETGHPTLLVGFFGGIVVWIVCFPAVLAAVGRRIDSFAPAVAVSSALVLAGFGVVFCWLGLSGLS